MVGRPAGRGVRARRGRPSEGEKFFSELRARAAAAARKNVKKTARAAARAVEEGD
jgi:hypothetical protein